MSVDHAELGRRLRRRRAALGRTVASVATDAALSVPYVANLENGRGNPTVAALDRLAEALGTRLVITMAEPGADEGPAAPVVPASLLEFARGHRFRHAAGALAGLLGDDRAVRTRLFDALAGAAAPLGRELPETDWQRLLDALVLVMGHPADRRGGP
ncbi:helix-turn-helix domain-containing protein [Nonomuraea terrae]|uniref:helix-turn-helix domain-containing protein n=1 Tax=Nonomuraea terrae TaxID=2530383 RepID=UPI0037B7F07A